MGASSADGVHQTASNGDTAALIARLDNLFAAVVSDLLDTHGYRHQVMAPRVRPLYKGARVVGTAATARAVPASEIPDAREEQYQLHLEAIEALKPGDIMVTSEIDVCFWGELMSIAARSRGASGVVIDGYTRDVRGIEAIAFPVFCSGINAADALGRSNVVEYGGTVEAGGVKVDQGDLILGDEDGVVVIPRSVAADVISGAEEKVRGENMVRQRLEEGMSVTEVFLTYGIL
jgi:4-hydroxy-4-methyl-2-oxoglutarate aldolase